MNNEQTHLLTHLFNPHCSLWRRALVSWFHSWKTVKLRKLPRATWLGNARAKIWTHISQPLRPCTSLTHSSFLLTLRGQESHPATRPAALGVALGFLPYGSQGKTRWSWKKSKWQEVERQPLKALVSVVNTSLWNALLMTYQGQFGNLCSWKRVWLLFDTAVSIIYTATAILAQPGHDLFMAQPGPSWASLPCLR